MDVFLYLILAAAVMGGLYWTLNQITRRQHRVDQELHRLEELAAEVTLNAGAVLEQADQRIALLQELLQAVEVKAQESAEGELSHPVQAVSPQAQPIQTPAATTAQTQHQAAALATPRREEPVTPPVAQGSDAPSTGTESGSPVSSLQRYQALRAAVWKLADEGQDALAIAKSLGLPRGEVQLMLSLRSRRVTA